MLGRHDPETQRRCFAQRPEAEAQSLRLKIILVISAIFSLSACSVGCSPESATPEQETHVPEAAKHAERPVVRAPKTKKPGDSVVYTIARGGTLINVANLYKLYHHEVVALNPDVPKDQDLGVDSEVVVYRHQGEDSESIGLPHDGSLVGGMPMMDGPGRKITAERWKTWATRHTVLQLDRVLRLWAKREKGAPPVLVSNLSARQGGVLSPHKTHQSGRDVDLSYITRWDGKRPVTWQHVTAQNLDARRTWALLKLLVKEADVEVMFIDRNLQKVLLAHAKKHGTVRSSRLPRWLEVAKGKGPNGPIIKHVPGHTDHIHVRFRCRPTEGRCRS